MVSSCSTGAHSACSTYLAEVELGVLRRLNTLDLHERDVGVLAALTPPVAHDLALAVETSLLR